MTVRIVQTRLKAALVELEGHADAPADHGPLFAESAVPLGPVERAALRRLPCGCDAPDYLGPYPCPVCRYNPEQNAEGCYRDAILALRAESEASRSK